MYVVPVPAHCVEIAAMIEDDAHPIWRNEFYEKYGIEVQPEVGSPLWCLRKF